MSGNKKKKNIKEWTTQQINFVMKQYKKGLGKRSIVKLYNEKFENHRTLDSIQHCISSNCAKIERTLPKVLVLDIETKPLVAFTWGTFDQNIALNQIIEDKTILAWSAKWLGEDKVFYQDQRGKTGASLLNEKSLLKNLWKLMDEADIILGQNSDKFDLKNINAKFLEYEIEPPSVYKKLDTLKIAKKHYLFTSNKLEFLSKKLNVTFKKLDHGAFPGFKLWDECIKGNLKAWKEMEKYNIHDILATEELFTKIAKFDHTETTTAAMRTFNANKKKR